MRLTVRTLALALLAIYCSVGPRFEVPLAALGQAMPPVTTLSDWHGDFYDTTSLGYFTFVTRASDGGFRAFGIEVKRQDDGTLGGLVVFNIYLPTDAIVRAFRLQLSRNLGDIAAASTTLIASGILELTSVPAPCCDGGDRDQRLAAQLITFAQSAIGNSADMQNSWSADIPR